MLYPLSYRGTGYDKTLGHAFSAGKPVMAATAIVASTYMTATEGHDMRPCSEAQKGACDVQEG